MNYIAMATKDEEARRLRFSQKQGTFDEADVEDGTKVSKKKKQNKEDKIKDKKSYEN